MTIELTDKNNRGHGPFDKIHITYLHNLAHETTDLTVKKTGIMDH